MMYIIQDQFGEELWRVDSLQEIRDWMIEAEQEYVQDELGDDDDEDEVVEHAREWINTLVVYKEEKINWRLGPDAKLEDYI
jgi:hypothetical protein